MVKESVCHRTSIRCPLNKSWCTCYGRLPDFHETSKRSWISVSTSKTLVVCKYNKNYCCAVKAIGVSNSNELSWWKQVWKNASCTMWLYLFIIIIIIFCGNLQQTGAWKILAGSVEVSDQGALRLLQSLCWRCIECAIPYERHVREEQHPCICGANKQ